MIGDPDFRVVEYYLVDKFKYIGRMDTMAIPVSAVKKMLNIFQDSPGHLVSIVVKC